MAQPSSSSTEDASAVNTNFQWTFSPIDEINLGTEISGGIGEEAIQAMQSEIDPSVSSDISGGFHLNCQIQDSRITVELKMVEKESSDAAHAYELASILSRVMIQPALEHLSKQKDDTVTIVVPKNPTESCTESYTFGALMARGGHAPLFATVLPDGINIDSIEMSNMVDSEGEPCGYLPRPLLHKWNVLHRGIGIVVCRDMHITRDVPMENLPELYCHQRTDTKRIFPSLYDMFVGGVATAGESLELTAAREVGEELNLTRPSLSDPLFRCTICTSYNRCVVTVYTYKYDPKLDQISWQEEEVQWGNFVAYDIVQKSGALSIRRLLEANKWPGKDSDIEETLGSIETTIARDEDKWDYVPDGLLVWNAWLKWLSN